MSGTAQIFMLTKPSSRKWHLDMHGDAMREYVLTDFIAGGVELTLHSNRGSFLLRAPNHTFFIDWCTAVIIYPIYNLTS